MTKIVEEPFAVTPGEITQNIENMQLHEIFSVTATLTPEVYILDVDITDMNNERYRCDYASTPDDTFGLSLIIREALLLWIMAGSPVIPYAAPPPQPYSLAIDTLWSRMTDPEAADFDTAMAVAQPIRLRRQFNTIMTMMSDSEIFTFTRSVLVTVMTETRADQILAE